MRQFFILLILVGVGYLVYTQGLPKWEEQKAAKARSEATADQSLKCVSSAESVIRGFSSGMRQFAAPPVDRSIWGSWFRDIGGQLSSADTACSCPTDACSSASGALYDLRGLMNDLDSFVARGGNPVLDAPSRLERINRMLASAKASSLTG